MFSYPTVGHTEYLHQSGLNLVFPIIISKPDDLTALLELRKQHLPAEQIAMKLVR